MYVWATFLSIVLLHVPTDRLDGFQNVWVGLFSLTFALIQVIEALIWLMREVNADVHRFAVWIEPALWLQCVVQCGCWSVVNASRLSLGLFATYIVLLLRSLFSTSRSAGAVAYPGKYGHLVWSRSSSDFVPIFHRTEACLYMLGLFLPLVRTGQGLQLLVGGLTCLYNLAQYWTTNEFASEWCFMAIYYVAATLIASLFFS